LKLFVQIVISLTLIMINDGPFDGRLTLCFGVCGRAGVLLGWSDQWMRCSSTSQPQEGRIACNMQRSAPFALKKESIYLFTTSNRQEQKEDRQKQLLSLTKDRATLGAITASEIDLQALDSTKRKSLRT
jgi:hypothetical protein